MKPSIAFSILFFLSPPVLAQDDDPPPLAKLGVHHIEKQGVFHRLINDGTLIGTQINQKYVVRADVANVFGVGTPWDAIAQIGSLAAWEPTLEPLTYYHRTGPVGAIFHELRSRNDGMDARLPIGVVGLECGTPAAYALNGQSITFFETNPNLKRLIVDTDRYFTFLSDARARGCVVDVRFRDTRKLLADAKERFAVLLVELFDTEFDPGERLTIEAVRVYMSRVRENGIVAIHISNKYFRLEPVAAAIAKELGLASRIWNDESESRPGKTASSWVVFAKDDKSLGVLGESAVEQIKRFGTKNQLLIRLLRDHPPEFSAREALSRVANGNGLSMEEFGAKFGSEAAVLEEYVRKSVMFKRELSLVELAEIIFGHMFRPLKPHVKVGVRKDGDKGWPRATLEVPASWWWLFGRDE